jgi:hypothetical protein
MTLMLLTLAVICLICVTATIVCGVLAARSNNNVMLFMLTLGFLFLSFFAVQGTLRLAKNFPETSGRVIISR